ncbi:MAG: Holliday junction branch migration protein RuvA [Planctomycetes bacterium]|nr:Holliday junction branch migration protein RuvA [Planctomycetota bacterium]
MFEYIRGTLHKALPGIAIIEAGGIGYRIQVPLSTSSRLQGGQVQLLLHHTILPEQGEERLYGFATDRERDFFRGLLEVKGIGPTTALQVMCAADIEELINLIVGGDVASLKKFKGIGPKTAERLVTELRDKLAPLATGPARNTQSARSLPQGQPATDAVMALVALGYPQNKSEQAVAKAAQALGTGAKPEDLVRRALQLV